MQTFPQTFPHNFMQSQDILTQVLDPVYLFNPPQKRTFQYQPHYPVFQLPLLPLTSQTLLKSNLLVFKMTHLCNYACLKVGLYLHTPLRSFRIHQLQVMESSYLQPLLVGLYLLMVQLHVHRLLGQQIPALQLL